MSSERQDSRLFHPSTPTDKLTGNNPSGFTTLRIPHSPSPMSPAVKTNTPESRLANALGHVIFNIPSTSFQDAAAAATVENPNPLRRTISDTSSSLTQDVTTITTTPSKVPEPERRNSPLRRTISDTTSSFSQDLSTITKTPPKVPEPANRITPLRRALSDPFSDYQPPKKTRTPPSGTLSFPNPRTTPPESSIRNQSPLSERLRKMEDMIKEIGRTCIDAVDQCQEHVEDDSPPDQEAEGEECIGLERLSDGGLRIRLECSCGKGFELLLKDNDYCFYRLT